MVNRFIIILLAMVVVASAVGCGQSTPSDTVSKPPPATQTGTTAKTATPTGTTAKTPTPTATVATIFPDKALDGVIRDVLGKYGSPLRAADVANITQIAGAREGIKDLTGMEYCTGLNQIYLDDNEVVDVTPLKNLTQLTRLYLWKNKVKDISPLAGLTNLKVLSVGGEVTDISAVAGMTGLTTLTLNGTFSDISAVANLTALTTLDLENSRVSDLSPIANLPKLTRLYLANNPVSDIKPLVDNPNIKAGIYIKLGGCPLSDKSINEYIPQLQQRGVIIQR